MALFAFFIFRDFFGSRALCMLVTHFFSNCVFRQIDKIFREARRDFILAAFVAGKDMEFSFIHDKL